MRSNGTQLLNHKAKVLNMANTLRLISDLYTKTEKDIVSTNPGIKNIPFSDSKNPAFDGIGQYGGDQGSPQNHVDEMADIVRRYYPDFTDEQVENFLKKLNSEGCGYVAITNTLFAYFAGREAEFEKIFGFPMRRADGELNYDALVTDFYSATDNHKKFIFDYVDNKEDPSDIEGTGTTREKREYRFEMYMKDHGIDCDVKNVTVTAKNYEALHQKGDIVVGINPCQLYDADGNMVVNLNGGHAMTVTGVTNDGMLKVSSWGKEYYIKPGTYSGHETYQQVIYK